MTTQAPDQVTIALTRAEARQALADPRALGSPERSEYRKVRAEYEADADLEADERYAVLLGALAEKLGRRRAHDAVFAPERVLGEEHTLPLFNQQVEELLRALGATTNSDARTIERMVREDGVIPRPPLLGRGDELTRNAYFARHVLAILYRVFCVPEDREELRSAARIVTGGLSREAALLLETLPNASGALLQRRER